MSDSAGGREGNCNLWILTTVCSSHERSLEIEEEEEEEEEEEVALVNSQVDSIDIRRGGWYIGHPILL